MSDSTKVGITVFIVLALALTVISVAKADEALVCPTGEHATSTLVTPAVPAVAEVSHVVHIPAVTHDVTTTTYNNVGMFHGDYIKNLRGQYILVGHNLGSYDKVDTVETIIDTPARDEVVIDTPAVEGTPAIYAESCEADVVVPVTPEPAVSNGGAGKCMNCNETTVNHKNDKVNKPKVDVKALLAELKAQAPELYTVLVVLGIIKA